MEENRCNQHPAQNTDTILEERENTERLLEIISRNASNYNKMLAYYRCAIMEVETKFKVLDEVFSVQYDRNPIEDIKSRIKSHDSVAGKLKRKGLPFTLESIENNIFDMAGIRVVCSFPEDIYMLADCLLEQDDVTLLEKKDYIKNPKESGYRSLHLIIEIPIFLQNEKRSMKVEVQLRTIAMDFWAALEHKLMYKKDIPEDLEKEIRAELVACASESASLDERMQAIRNKVQPELIYKPRY